MEVLQLHNAVLRFGNKKVLSEVFFTLKTGDILGIFGRNGCGKSTLLQMIFGTLKKGTVRLSVNGIAFNPSSNIASQCIALLPQHPILPRNLLVRDVIPIYFSEGKKQDSIFYDPLIANIADKKTGELSLGQARYFEVLLVANLNHPFLLLDEPFSLIEPLYKKKLKELLETIRPKKGIIMTDHYYNDVLDIATQNLLIKNGKGIPIENARDLQRLKYLGSSPL